MDSSNSGESRDGVFAVGATVLLIGAVAIIFIPFWGVFGLPFYLIGAVIVVVSRATWKRKVGYIFLPVLAFFVWQPIESYLNKGEATTYLIPEGYTGPVRVAFNQASGEPLEYEDGRRIFQIDEHGLLVSQAARGPGYLDERFYYVSPTGTRTRLSILDHRRCRDESERTERDEDWMLIGVFRGGTTIRPGPTQLLPDTLIFTNFIVASCETQNQYSRQTIEPSRQDTLLVRAIWGEVVP